MSHNIVNFPDSAGWEHQQQCEERQQWEMKKAADKLDTFIREVVDEGVTCIEELHQSDINRMIALLIRTAAPVKAWFFIGLAPNSSHYPGLVADALDRKFGGFLGLELTSDRLLKAVLDGAVQYGEHLIQEAFERELEQRKTRQR